MRLQIVHLLRVQASDGDGRASLIVLLVQAKDVGKRIAMRQTVQHGVLELLDT